MAPFIFATGIENSYPTIALPDGRAKNAQLIRDWRSHTIVGHRVSVDVIEAD